MVRGEISRAIESKPLNRLLKILSQLTTSVRRHHTHAVWWKHSHGTSVQMALGDVQSSVTFWIFMPSPHRASVCLYVCPSLVYLTLSRERKEAENRQEGSQWHGRPVTRFGGRKVKGQGHRPLNAVTDNQSYLRNVKAYRIQTWYTGGVWWPASPTRAVISNVI